MHSDAQSSKSCLATFDTTMGIGVTVTRAFSLLLPPILDEFGWAFGLYGRRVLCRDAGVDAGGAVPRRAMAAE
jgi:hypothetical protein